MVRRYRSVVSRVQNALHNHVDDECSLPNRRENPCGDSRSRTHRRLKLGLFRSMLTPRTTYIVPVGSSPLSATFQRHRESWSGPQTEPNFFANSTARAASLWNPRPPVASNSRGNFGDFFCVADQRSGSNYAVPHREDLAGVGRLCQQRDSSQIDRRDPVSSFASFVCPMKSAYDDEDPIIQR